LSIAIAQNLRRAKQLIRRHRQFNQPVGGLHPRAGHRHPPPPRVTDPRSRPWRTAVCAMWCLPFRPGQRAHERPCPALSAPGHQCTYEFVVADTGTYWLSGQLYGQTAAKGARIRPILKRESKARLSLIADTKTRYRLI
jgi:hypothetical protein